MFWKIFLITPLVCLFVPSKVYARQYQPGKHFILNKLCLVDRSTLDAYVHEFLENNSITPEMLACTNNKTLLSWAIGLAKKIEKRYYFSPSTVMNRSMVHEKKLFKILKKHRKHAQAHTLYHSKHWEECHNQSADIPALRLLMDQYAQREHACAETLNTIEKRIENMDPENIPEKEHIHHILSTEIQNLHDQYHAVIESFTGAPIRSIREKLDAQWHILQKEEKDLNHRLHILLKHGQILHHINTLMHKKLRFIFSDAHLGMTPYTNKTMGLKYALFHKAIREITALRQALHSEKKPVVDTLCRFLAMNLWTQWLSEIKDEAQKIFLQKKVALLMDDSMENTQALEQILSPFVHRVVLSQAMLDDACDQILGLLNTIQEGLLQDSVYKAFAQKMPFFLKTMDRKLALWKYQISKTPPLIESFLKASL